MRNSNYENEFEKILARENFPSNFIPLRKKAFKQFLDNGISKRYWENLRFTNLSAIKKNIFRVSEASDSPPENFNYPDSIVREKYKIVFYNGHYQKNMANLPDSIKILSNLEYYSDPTKKSNSTIH